MHDVRIEYDMPAAEYHAIPAVSKSLLGKFDRTAAHGKYALEHPHDSDALALGRAFHTLSLEPEKAAQELAVAPVCDKRTKEGKVLFAEFEASSAGKTVLTAAQYAQAVDMAQSFRECPEYAHVIADCKIEVSIFWQDADTWEPCKTRLDFVDPERGIVGDLKSVRDASDEGFARDAFAYGYHMAAAIHCDAYELAFGQQPNFYVMPVVEKDAPYLSRFFFTAPSSDFVTLGRREYRERLKKYSAARVSQKWEGYPVGLQELFLPAWVQRKIEQGEM